LKFGIWDFCYFKLAIWDLKLGGLDRHGRIVLWQGITLAIVDYMFGKEVMGLEVSQGRYIYQPRQLTNRPDSGT
jgi:hypothetical protein